MKLHKIPFLLPFIIFAKGEGVIDPKGVSEARRDARGAVKSHLELAYETINKLSRVTLAIAYEAAAIQQSFKFRPALGELLEANLANLSTIITHNPLTVNNHLDGIVERYKRIYESTNGDKDDLLRILKLNEDLMTSVSSDYVVNKTKIHDFFDHLGNNSTISRLKGCNETHVEMIVEFWNVINEKKAANEDDKKIAIVTLKNRIPEVRQCMTSIKEYYSFVYPISKVGEVFRNIFSARATVELFKKKQIEYENFPNDLEKLKNIAKKIIKDWEAPQVDVYKEVSMTVQLHKDMVQNKTMAVWLSLVGYGLIEDLKMVREDLNSVWFKEKVANGKSIKFLENSLEAFFKFSEYTGKLETTWIKFKAFFKAERKNLLESLSFYSSINQCSDVASGEGAIENMKKIYNGCWKGSAQTEDFARFDEHSKTLSDLNSTIFEVLAWCNETVKQNDFDVMETALDSLNNLNLENLNPQETINEVREIQNFEDLNDFFERFLRFHLLQKKYDTDYQLLHKVNLVDVMEETAANLTKSKSIANLKCLKMKEFQSSKIHSTVEFITSVRRIGNSSDHKKIKDAVKIYSDMRTDYVAVEKFLEETRRQSKQNEQLTKQNPVLKFKHSMKIATKLAKGMICLRDLIESYKLRSEILNSANYDNGVNDKIANFNENKQVKEFWSGSPGYLLEHVVRELDNLNMEARKYIGSDLGTIGTLFDVATNVSGIKGVDLLFEYVHDQLDSYDVKDKNFQMAKKNSENLAELWLDFTVNHQDLRAASESIKDIKEYFDEIFKVNKSEKVFVNSYLGVIIISFGILFAIVLGGLIAYGLTESGRNKYLIWWIYWFGKPEAFEKRWRYSLFLDKTDHSNSLLEAVREVNLTNVANCVKKGAFINAYNRHGNTALHLATKRLYPDIVEILIKNGADRTLLNVQNKKPEEIIGTDLDVLRADQKAKIEKIKNIYLKYQNKKFRIRVPELFPVSSFHIYADKSTDDKLTNQFMEVFKSIASNEPQSSTTHCIVKTSRNGTLETDSLESLLWIFNGTIIVKESWMSDCLKNKKNIAKDYNYLVENVKYNNVVYNTVLKWSEAMSKGSAPYLYGVYIAICLGDYANLNTMTSIINSQGGTLLDAFPTKNYYNVGSHPYFHAHLGPLFIITDGQYNLQEYKNDPDKMYTFFTEAEFINFMLKREINIDRNPNPISVAVGGDI